MSVSDNPYLARRLEESSGYYGRSFSNRYMNWKRFRSLAQTLRACLRRLPAEVVSPAILDVGCGDGWIDFGLIAQSGPGRRPTFTGIDLSAFDIDFARHRKEHFGEEGCEFHVMDACALELGGRQFDVVISSEVIEHIPEPQRLIRSVYRVLKPGGLFIVTTPRKGGGLPARLGSALNRLRGAAQEPAYRRTTGAGCDHVSVKSAREWRALFREEGLRVLSTKGTGGLFFGGPSLDRHRVVFALSVIADAVLEALPWSSWWSELLIFELEKR